MFDEITKKQVEAVAEIKAALDKTQLEKVETKWLGRKNGVMLEIMKELQKTVGEERKQFGQAANQLKQAIEQALREKHAELSEAAWSNLLAGERLDVTQPALPGATVGHYHPLTLVQRELEDLFTSMGFMVVDGPELESDYFNFTALNIPADHPARDMQDTLYIKDHPEWLMRTQTSPVQIRAMQKYGAPLRIVVPGKCFRNEATDARHEHTFYQLEGLVLDKGINFSHLKATLEAVAQHLYGPQTKMRLLPKFYPFVEPGVRGEVTCSLCAGQGCRVCKNSGWLEIFGAGLVHPNVLEAGGINPEKYQGFAFGFGLTRLVMLKYGINDVRLLESGSMKFLEQF